MNPNSAYHLVSIVVGTDYSPAAQTTDFVDPNTGKTVSPAIQVPTGVTPPVYALLCTKTNTGTTKIQALGDSSSTDFPAGSLVIGVVYYIYLKKLVDDGGGSFVGFQYDYQPLVF